MNNNKSRTYIVAFLITAAIFATAILASDYFNQKRVEQIKSIEDRISIDILSLETQFELLEELSCSEIADNSILSRELSELASKLSYTESKLGDDNQEVIRLKRQYSLLQIKDLLLMRKITNKCNLDPIFILYFYSNAGDCKECTKEGFVLTDLAKDNPNLRVYSFDYNLDLSALRTLISINEIENKLPALVIDEKVLYGFQSREDIEEILPELKVKEVVE